MITLIQRIAFIGWGTLFAATSLVTGSPSVNKFFVANAPSTGSEGADSILVLDLAGNKSSVLVDTRLNIMGLNDIACDPTSPQHIFAVIGNEVQEFDAEGNRVNTIRGLGDPGFPLVMTFDSAGNFYVASFSEMEIFKNGRVLASLPPGGIGKLAADSKGNLYITRLHAGSNKIHRIDPLGNVTLFADESDSLNSPFGLAIDSEDNIYVANNPPSAPAFILKFDPAGTATSFATGITFQPIIRGMVFDSDDNLYATLQDDTILKFDPAGNQSVFADKDNGLNFPVAIAFGSCPVITPPLSIPIDIKPGGDPNCVNIDGNGVIPVAVLGSADFDVNDIDIETLSFAGLDVRIRGNDARQCSIEDVSGDFTSPEGAPDGYPDLVCQFVDDPMSWDPGDGTATLTGELSDGTPFEGTDSICVVP